MVIPSTTAAELEAILGVVVEKTKIKTENIVAYREQVAAAIAARRLPTNPASWSLAQVQDAWETMTPQERTLSPPPQQNQSSGIARVKMEKNELEAQLADMSTTLGVERAAKKEQIHAKQQAEAQLAELKDELKEMRAVVVSQDRKLSARVETNTLKENNTEFESQWANQGVVDGQHLLQENIEQRATIGDLEEQINQLQNSISDLNANAMDGNALIAAANGAKEEAAIAKQAVEGLTGENSNIEEINMNITEQLADTQAELAKCRSQQEKLELELKHMHTDNYTWIIEHAQQLQALRQQQNPAQDSMRSTALATFLGICLGRLTPPPPNGQRFLRERGLGKFLHIQVDVRANAHGRGDPPGHPGCRANLARVHATRCPPQSVLSKYTRAPRALVETALRAIASGKAIETSVELLFFVVVAARLAGLELEMRPALAPLMASTIPPPFRSVIKRFIRKPVNGEELRVICSAQGVVCGRTNVGFMEGTLCLLVKFDRHTLHVVNYTSFTRTGKDEVIEMVVHTVDRRKVGFSATVEGIIRLWANSKSGQDNALCLYTPQSSRSMAVLFDSKTFPRDPNLSNWFYLPTIQRPPSPQLPEQRVDAGPLRFENFLSRYKTVAEPLLCPAGQTLPLHFKKQGVRARSRFNWHLWHEKELAPCTTPTTSLPDLCTGVSKDGPF
ncbi:hypothetical protein B0T18DRAFT_386866 [Schizothecium vesticola]|uniref:Uncharacterized protein n=1 Tax=Schizothecium vesticola TaxID=314040 RepID=A0AA40KDN7_9PEZI|nr:hypothetical protein B0T18DRAFT_386866 [Schizothecium vesticola]